MIKKGLSPRFAEVGKIKIGGKGETRKSSKGNNYQLPVRYEHFVVTTTEKGKDGNFVVDHDIMSQLDEKPKELSIRLLFDDIDMNFHTSFQYYVGSKLACKGDGETAERTSIKDGTKSKVTCDPDTCEFFQSDKCKVSGILSCMLTVNSDIGGVHRFRTHSWNSVSNILAALKYFKDNTNGILQGLPLKLKMLKKATQEHGNVNTVTIVLDGIELLEMRKMALLEYEDRMKLGIDMKMLEARANEAGFMIDHDDPKDVQAEWYPVTDSQPESGVSAEDVSAELDKEPEKVVEAEPVKEEDGKPAVDF